MIVLQTVFQATAEKVVTLEDERDAVPSVDSIKQELDAVKREINRNKENIHGCKVSLNTVSSYPVSYCSCCDI